MKKGTPEKKEIEKRQAIGKEKNSGKKIREF
jgi:hypothetical protein